MWVWVFSHHKWQKIFPNHKAKPSDIEEIFCHEWWGKIHTHISDLTVITLLKITNSSQKPIETIKFHFLNFFLFLHFFLSNWSNQHAFFLFLPYFCIFCNFFLSKWRNHYANPKWQPYFNIYHTNTLTCASKTQYSTCEVLTFTGTCESKSQYSTCEVLTFTVTMDLHDELFYG